MSMIAGRGGDECGPVGTHATDPVAIVPSSDPVAIAPGTDLITHKVDATAYFECADWLQVLELCVVVAVQFFRKFIDTNERRSWQVRRNKFARRDDVFETWGKHASKIVVCEEGSKRQTAGGRRQKAGGRRQKAENRKTKRLLTVHCLLLTAHRSLLTAY